jgi:hypothetical protein
MNMNVEGLKALINAALNDLEGCVAGLQLSLEKGQAAGGAIYGILEGSGNQDALESAQIVQAVNEEIETRIEQCHIAKERLQQYMSGI